MSCKPSIALTLFVTLLLLASDATAQRRKGPKPERLDYYDGKLENALVEAKERNAPILIVACKEGEEANDRFREQLRDNGSLAEKVSGAIVILVNDGTHEKKTIQVRNAAGKKVKVEVCKAYHTSSCDVHKRNWDAVYQTFIADRRGGQWGLPGAVIVEPDGEIAQVIEHQEPPGDDEMLDALKLVRAKAGPSITRAQLKAVQSLISEAESAAGSKAWPRAWQAWTEILTITSRGGHAERAQEGVDAAEEGLRTRLAELEQGTGDATADWRALARFAFEAEGSPVAKQAASAAKGLRGQVPKEVVEEVELDLEADGLLREAKQLLRAGEDKKAERLLKKLIGKKYAGTTASAEALGLMPEDAPVPMP